MDLDRLASEVDCNYDAFVRRLPDLLREHASEFVLLRATEPQGFFASESEALHAGRHRFADGLYSVQEVTDRPVDLGFYSHAVNPRIA